MADSKERNVDGDISCHIHENEALVLYCCECVDFICLQCFIEHHQKHEMKRLSTIKHTISEQLFPFLFSKHEQVAKTIKELKQFVEHEISESDAEEHRMYSRIKHLEEKRKKEIEESANTLLNATEEKYLSYKLALQDLTKRIGVIQSQYETSFGDNQFSVENATWLKQMELYLFIKQCNETKQELEISQNCLKPKFEDTSEHKASVGLVCVDDNDNDNSSYVNIKTETEHNSCKMYNVPENYKTKLETGSEYEESVDGMQLDSDEVRVEQPNIIDTTSLQKSLRKSISMSDLSATLLNNKLFKFPGCIPDDSDC